MGREPGIGPAQLTCPNTDTDHSDQSVPVLFAPLFLEGRILVTGRPGRGTRAIVTGKLRQRSYKTKEGEKRTVYEVDVNEVGVSLRSATAKVSKASRSSVGNGGRGQGDGDPWASDSADSTATSRLSDIWRSAQVSG